MLDAVQDQNLKNFGNGTSKKYALLFHHVVCETDAVANSKEKKFFI